MAKRKTDADERLDLVFHVQIAAGVGYQAFFVVAKDMNTAAEAALARADREGMKLPHVEEIRRLGFAVYATGAGR